ncbi:type IV secretion protein IcmB [Burkholderia vietnamiensis]|nr:type IV secretion protein IcmB [Burkholderia vietnamiensis]
MSAREFASGLVDAVEGVLGWISSGMKQSLEDYIDVEHVDDSRTLIYRDGSHVTFVEIGGATKMVGEEEFAYADGVVSKALRSYLGTGGHGILVYFSCDPENVSREIREALAPSIATAARLGLQLDDLFEEDIKHLAKFCASEKIFLAVITRPSALTRAELKADTKAKTELLSVTGAPRMKGAPNFMAAVSALRTRHSSFLAALLSDLKTAEIKAGVLNVHAAVREQRMSVDPEFTDEDWRPVLFGDKIPMRYTSRDKRNMADLLWPRIGRQIAPRNWKEIDLETLEVGDRIYAPMYIERHPADIRPFQALFNRVHVARIPWRMTFLIESGGLAIMGFKKLMAMIVGFSNSDNALVKNAIEQLQLAVRNGEDLDVKYRVDFATWAPKGNVKLLDERAKTLAKAIQGWGGTDVRKVSGDVYQGFTSSCLALSFNSVATPSAASLNDVTQMLPLYRPASPWKSGAVLYRTPDGRLWTYQPNSPVQSSWITLMYAEPRSGKSVNGNRVNLALCLSPGIVRLPLISIIDVGKASSGLISLLKYALPESQRHLVASIRLRMTDDYATNPFDLQLGCEVPLPHEWAFLMNFVLLLVTPLGKQAPDDGMAGLCRMAIEEAFKECSSNANPKLYSPNVEGAEPVDAAIERLGIEIDKRTTWREVVDQLFAHGLHHEAMLAQRYAVPVLEDIASVTRDPQFMDMYGNKQTESGEPLLYAFSRMIAEAVRSYPILNKPTRFDIGEARVVSIDLDEVAKSGSAAADHQTAVCYMLARHVTAKNFYLTEDYLPSFPPAYRAYHERRIREIRQDKKHIQFDEFHRTKKIQPVREQVVADMREGGKLGIMITLISQSIEDFDETMKEFATGKIILSKANEAGVRALQTVFGVSKTVEYAVKNMIRPPGPQGSTFVGMFSTKEGDTVHLLNNTIGGINLWAFSTSNEDTFVRDELYRRIGPVESRRILARLYPGGSLSDEIERRKQRKEDSGVMDSRVAEGVITELIDEIQAKHERLMQEAA